jgi:hypothetical protein
MYLDERLEIGDALALSTVGTGYALLGDVIDLGLTGRNPGVGEPLCLVIQVTTAFDSAGDALIAQFILVSDAQAAIAVDGSATEHVATPLIAQATWAAGYTVVLALPQGAAYERYLGLIQNATVAAASAGAVNAFITADVAQWKAFARGD